MQCSSTTEILLVAFKRLPSWAFQTIRWESSQQKRREWQHHKKKNFVPCKAFLIRVRSSSMGIVCWGEDECAKKMSFGSLLSCSSWLYLEVIRVGELLSLRPCGLSAPHSGAFTSQFASRSSPPTPHKSLFKAHLASPYYCRLPFNFTIFCKVRIIIWMQ